MPKAKTHYEQVRLKAIEKIADEKPRPEIAAGQVRIAGKPKAKEDIVVTSTATWGGEKS